MSTSIVHLIGEEKQELLKKKQAKEQEMRKGIYNRKRIEVNDLMEIPGHTEFIKNYPPPRLY